MRKYSITKDINIAAEYALPLYNNMMDSLKKSCYLHVDETRLNVLKKNPIASFGLSVLMVE